MLNNYLERDVDTRMERTRRRPIAAGAHPGRAARSPSGLALVAAGSLALWALAGGLAAAFALLGAAYYVVVYTMLLKPRTALSSVPGRARRRLPRADRLGRDRRSLVAAASSSCARSSSSGRRRTSGRWPWRARTTTAPPASPRRRSPTASAPAGG